MLAKGAMKTTFYKTLWGMAGTLDEKLAKVKAAGYDGFEDWVSDHAVQRPAIERAGIGYVAMVHGDTPEGFKRELGEAYDCGATKATVHFGAPTWSENEMARFLEQALKIAEGVPFQVNFETHRGRGLYEPMHTARLLRRFDTMHVVADLSHWAVVTESLLGAYKEPMDLVFARTRHIHARVGHEEGPQVSDPRSPYWKRQVDAHFGWWDAIRAEHLKRGETEITVDPEFGPANYMPVDAKGEPTADLWEVSLWMRDALKTRWA